MDILTLIISLALGGGALALIAYPLWQQTRPEAIFHVDRSGQTLEEYQARYQAALAAIKDLMFDHEMGKVSTEDYEKLLARAKLEAAQIRAQIDRLSQSSPVEADLELEAEIEALIAQTRTALLSNGNEALAQEIEAEIEALKHIDLATETGQPGCPQCGNPYQIDDAFCSGCGYSLAHLSAETSPACPTCGAAIEPDDAFCAKCGATLKEKVATEQGAG